MFEAEYRFLSTLANFFVVYRFNSNPLCRLRLSSVDCGVLAYARVAIELKSALGNNYFLPYTNWTRQNLSF